MRDLSAQKSDLHMVDPVNGSILSEEVSDDLYPDFLNVNSQLTNNDPNYYNCFKGNNEPSRKYLK